MIIPNLVIIHQSFRKKMSEELRKLVQKKLIFTENNHLPWLIYYLMDDFWLKTTLPRNSRFQKSILFTVIIWQSTKPGHPKEWSLKLILVIFVPSNP